MNDYHARVLFVGAPLEYEIAATDTIEQQIFTYEQIGIDEVRALIAEAHRRPKEGFSAKQVVLRTLKITREAEQASLKILEEPPQSTQIVLVLPTGTQLLPTVLSRVQTETVEEDSLTSVFAEWLQLSAAERIKVVEEKMKAKDTVWLQSFKTELQQYVAEQSGSIESISEVQLVLQNLGTRGASNKMLLEHLALTLPLTRA